MTKIIKKIAIGIMIILPIGVAVSVVAYLMTHKPGPGKKQIEESVRALRVIKTSYIDLIPRAVGYGTAKPESIWKVVAEVRGTIAYIHPRLKAGELIPAQTVLIQLDPTEYELAISKAMSNVAKTKAEIEELAIEEENGKKMIAVETQSLILAKNSIDRKRKLLKHDAASRDDVDREERVFLQQKQTFLKLENSLALIPSKRESFQAILKAYQSDLKQAKRDLSKTIIKAPYNCRPGNVNLKTGQFIQTGQLLFSAHGTDGTEINAHFRIEHLQNLLNEQMRSRLQPGLSMGAFSRLFKDVRVIVELQSGEWSANWIGRIDRFREMMDIKTREFVVVVAVDHPYKQAIPGKRPPLIDGMFCRVELQGPVQSGRVVVPRSAIYDHTLFVVDPNHRLQKKQITIDFLQSDFAVIRSGLSRDEIVVLSDPSPAMIGMKTAPVIDHTIYQQMIALTKGKEDI